MLATARQLEWMQVPALAQALAEKHAATAKQVEKAIKDIPRDAFYGLFRNNDGDLFLTMGDWAEKEDIDQWKAALEPLCDNLRTEAEAMPETVGLEGYVKIASGPERRTLYQEKEAYNKYLQRLGQVMGFIKSPWSEAMNIPGYPGPIAGTLAGGILGAGLGYGAGWLGEKLMPNQWEKNRLRRTLALTGGLAGAVPGAAWMTTNVLGGHPWYSTHMTKGELPKMPAPPKTPTASEKQALFGRPGGYPGYNTGMSTGAMGVPLDDLSNSIYRDPRVSNRLSPQQQVATTGLMESAYAARGGGPRIVTPVDVAKITAGMGSGYLSGLVVGKALGALTGMPPKTQDRLKDTGMWAGVIANLVPLAFGGR